MSKKRTKKELLQACMSPCLDIYDADGGLSTVIHFVEDLAELISRGAFVTNLSEYKEFKDYDFISAFEYLGKPNFSAYDDSIEDWTSSGRLCSIADNDEKFRYCIKLDTGEYFRTNKIRVKIEEQQ